MNNASMYANMNMNILNNENSSRTNASSASSSFSLLHPENLNNRLNTKSNANWMMSNVINSSNLLINNNGMFSPSPIHPQIIMLEQQLRNSSSVTPIETSPNNVLKNATHIPMYGNQLYTNNSVSIIRDNTPSSFITNNIQLPLSASSYVINYDNSSAMNSDLNSISNKPISMPQQPMYTPAFHNINMVNNQQILQPQHLLSNSSSASSLNAMDKESEPVSNMNNTIMKPMFSYKDIVRNENSDQLPADKAIDTQLLMVSNMNTFIPMSNINHNISNTLAMPNLKSCSLTPVAPAIPLQMQIPFNPMHKQITNPLINNINMNMINNMNVNNNIYNNVPMLSNHTLNNMNMNIMNMSMSSLLSNEALMNASNNSLKSAKPKLTELRSKLNPNMWPLNPRLAKFFVIKSFGEDDVHKSIKYGLWCSTGRGNRKLDEAFADSERLVAGTGNDARDQVNGCPIYLFFSVNRSGCFCGMAQMISCYDENRHFTSWVQDDKWQGSFVVKWIFVKDIPNKDLKDITLPNNDHRPVTFSRDTQEIPFTQGIQLLQRFVEYTPKTNILQDFQYYDKREKDMYNMMLLNAGVSGINLNGSNVETNNYERRPHYHGNEQFRTGYNSYMNGNKNYGYAYGEQRRYGNQYRYDNRYNGSNDGYNYGGRRKGRVKNKRNNHYHHHNHKHEKYVNKNRRRHRSNIAEDKQYKNNAEPVGGYKILKRRRNDNNNGGRGRGVVVLNKTQTTSEVVRNDMNMGKE